MTHREQDEVGVGTVVADLNVDFFVLAAAAAAFSWSVSSSALSLGLCLPACLPACLSVCLLLVMCSACDFAFGKDLLGSIVHTFGFLGDSFTSFSPEVETKEGSSPVRVVFVCGCGGCPLSCRFLLGECPAKQIESFLTSLP